MRVWPVRMAVRYNSDQNIYIHDCCVLYDSLEYHIIGTNVD